MKPRDGSTDVGGRTTHLDPDDAAERVRLVAPLLFFDAPFIEQKIAVRRAIALQASRQFVDQFANVAGGAPRITATLDDR
ncbi:hypothetical protein [Accumulibacter sp.]|uniref:hypothetical protein n=1 Tax=Accumulibacter sp. TaxID=2053492 RepID=UPI0025FDA996|nr:hypothetical protein [Accumulibacter sp.]MCM8624888.1 hypothetical protein [Accumulibacter sp.]